MNFAETLMLKKKVKRSNKFILLLKNCKIPYPRILTKNSKPNPHIKYL